MSVPDFFYSNIEMLTPLLGREEPLQSLLIASPFSSVISTQESFFGKTYACLWPGMDYVSGANSQQQLESALKRTMEVFFYVLKDMDYMQETYLRFLKANLNGAHPDTSDLEIYRGRLKKVYESVGPFIHNIKKSDSGVSKELISILTANQKDQKDATQRFSREMLTHVNKEISALIHLECIHGQLLPYGELLLGIYTTDESANEIVRRILPKICSEVDFKISYRALHLIHGLATIKLPDFTHTFYQLFKKDIRIVEQPDRKLDLWRRSLKPGSSIATQDGKTIVLGESVGRTKKEGDGRIAFKIDGDPKHLIVFYPNKAYLPFIQTRNILDPPAVHTIKPVDQDPHCRWSVEPYKEKNLVSFSLFYSFVKHFLTHGPLTSIDFSELVLDPSTRELSTLKPIYPGGEDYALFVDSLIAYYETKVYNKEFPTLYSFLTKCLVKSKKIHTEFFEELALDAAKLPLSAVQSEIDFVISVAVGKKYILSPSSDTHASMDYTVFSKKCQTMVEQIIERRTSLVLNLRFSEQYSKINELSLLDHFQKNFPKQVCTWILPPK